MGDRDSQAQDKRQVFIEFMEQSLHASRHCKTLPRNGTMDFVEAPQLFTTLKGFSTEWNLCGKFDPTRRMNVVADSKLQRKKVKYRFVDKLARLRMNSEAVTLARNELEIMCFLSNYCNLHLGYIHRNLVHLYGYCTFRRKMHVIVEFCELGSLMTACIRAPDPGLQLVYALTEEDLCDTMHQICAGIDFLHTNGVAHGDLALDNVYVTSDNVVKIGDFDRAMFVGPESVPQQLKANEPPRKTYGAPELFTNETRKVDLMKTDMWSLGIIFIMLLTKKPLFDSASADDKGFQLYTRVGLRAYMKAMYLEQSAFCKLSDEMVDLAEGLLTPAARLTIKEAMKSSWFSPDRVTSKRCSSRDLINATPIPVRNLDAEVEAQHDAASDDLQITLEDVKPAGMYCTRTEDNALYASRCDEHAPDDSGQQ